MCAMNYFDMQLVIARSFRLLVEGAEEHFEYLTKEDTWSKKKEDAYLYGSSAVFTHADEWSGRVYLRLKNREIEVFEADFF